MFDTLDTPEWCGNYCCKFTVVVTTVARSVLQYYTIDTIIWIALFLPSLQYEVGSLSTNALIQSTTPVNSANHEKRLKP